MTVNSMGHMSKQMVKTITYNVYYFGDSVCICVIHFISVLHLTNIADDE